MTLFFECWLLVDWISRQTHKKDGRAECDTGAAASRIKLVWHIHARVHAAAEPYRRTVSPAMLAGRRKARPGESSGLAGELTNEALHVRIV